MFHEMRSGAKISAVAFALLIIFGLAACGGGTTAGAGQSPSGTANPVKGGELTIANQGDIFSIDFWSATAAHSEAIWTMQQMFQPLVLSGKDGKTFEPAVAESWQLSPDRKVMTFKIVPGLKFSDGAPVASEDVKYSLDMATKSSEVFGFLNAAISEVVAVDPTTVEVHTKVPWGPLLGDLSIYSNSIVPKDLGGKSREEFFSHPVGTGAFMLDSWSKGSKMRLVRNPYYVQKGQPYLDAVVYTTVPDDNTRSLQLRGGQAQVMGAPPYSMVESLKATPGLTVNVSDAMKNYYLLMNEHEASLADLNVRKAIAFALDRDAMVKALMFGYGQASNSHLPPAAPFYDASVQIPTFDLEKAKAALAASKFPNGFTTKYVVGGSDTFGVSLAELVQQDLAKIGITVQISRIDAGAVSQARQNFEYGLSADWYMMDIPDPDEMLTYVLDAKAGGAEAYYTGYHSDKMSALMKAAREETDQAKRQELYLQVQQLAAQDLPQIPLFYAPGAWALSDKVQGFEMYPMANIPLENVWLTK